MPIKPGIACQCGGVRINGVCAKCGLSGRRSEATRQTARQRGYTHAWDVYSQRYRTLNPWCVECLSEGKVVRAEVVDHVIPHRGDQRLFWDADNHQGLCKRHHDVKTARGE